MPKVEWLQVAGGLMSDSMRLYFGAAMALALSACIPVPNAGMRLAMRSADTVRRQNIWRNLRRKLAECGPRLGVDVMRPACGVASADVRWSVV